MPWMVARSFCPSALAPGIGIHEARNSRPAALAASKPKYFNAPRLETSPLFIPGLDPRYLSRRRMIEDGLRFRIPINLFPGPISARGHHAGHGVGEPVLYCGIRLFAASQTIQPVSHMRRLLIAHPSRRKGLVAGQQNVFDRPPVVHRRVVFVISLFFDQLPSRAAFAAVIDQCRFLAHDARKTGRVIAKTRGIADQRAPRICEQRLKGIWILAAVGPSENTTAGHY